MNKEINENIKGHDNFFGNRRLLFIFFIIILLNPLITPYLWGYLGSCNGVMKCIMYNKTPTTLQIISCSLPGISHLTRLILVPLLSIMYKRNGYISGKKYKYIMIVWLIPIITFILIFLIFIISIIMRSI